MDSERHAEPPSLLPPDQRTQLHATPETWPLQHQHGELPQHQLKALLKLRPRDGDRQSVPHCEAPTGGRGTDADAKRPPQRRTRGALAHKPGTPAWRCDTGLTDDLEPVANGDSESRSRGVANRQAMAWKPTWCRRAGQCKCGMTGKLASERSFPPMALVRLNNGFKYECQRSKGGADGRKDMGRNLSLIHI